MSFQSAEKRPLKRQKMGPPDVYPQEIKQREDDLDDISVKQGFTHRPQIHDEYGSAHNASISSAKVASYFNAILKRKVETNQLPDTGRKKQQINKDNFWLVTPRSKSAIEVWFKDLAGVKPLISLAKKVPIFSKREDMFLTLCEYSVPMIRAKWFIKMTSAYYESKVAESKMKRRPQPDNSQEWSQILVPLLQEQFNKIVDSYQSPNGSLAGVNGATMQLPQSSPHSLGSGAAVCTPLITHVWRIWNYCLQLVHFMYQEGLLDRQEILEWLVDLVARWKENDSIVRIVLPLCLQYMDDIVVSEYLSRKLSYHSAIKLKQLIKDAGCITPRAESPANADSSNKSTNEQNEGQIVSCATVPVIGGNQHVAHLQELLSCQQHRPVILSLCGFIQAVTLDCPTALVWNSSLEGKPVTWLSGSPLDLLPCSPSDLPMPSRSNNQQVRNQLLLMEEHIRQRSTAAANRWSLDRLAHSVAGSSINCILATLDAMDRHCFDRMDNNFSIDTLYAKVFGRDGKLQDGLCDGTHSEMLCPPGNVLSPTEESIVQTLCEWAVSVQRSGEHRALVVARLLEKRQNDLTSSESDDRDSLSSNPTPSGYVFQNLLIKFLDTLAPTLDEGSLIVHSQEFGNLILLFSELIRQDVFSHDAYMCYLISRGDLTTGMPNMRLDTFGSEKKDEADNIDEDLDKILRNITKEAGAPDSPKDDVNTSLEEGGSIARRGGSEGRHRPPRHLIYAQHFPLPQNDAYLHEINQRFVLLYGVGKARDEARHASKKLTKEILKLFSKKFSIDIAEGGKMKKSSRGEFNFESILSRFCGLSYFDQHHITSTVSTQIMEMLAACSSGNSSYLPTHDHVAFIMDLMEVALNVNGLISLCIQIINEVPEIELQLMEQMCLVGTYCPVFILHAIGVLRKYHCCLLVSQEETISVFEGLLRTVKTVNSPNDCTSMERVVFAHLFDLYGSCSFLKVKSHDTFSMLCSKIKQTLYASVSPAVGTYRWSPQFMEEYIKNPRLKFDTSVLKQLSDPSHRYSFTCSVFIEACSTTSNEKLNDLATLCCELTAVCNALSSEWLGVLHALCCSSTNSPGYIDVLQQVSLRDPLTTPLIHSSLAVFTAILIARHCFTLPDFLKHVVLPSLVDAWNKGESDPDAEPGARLTCHLLLRIFKRIELPQPSQYAAGSPQNVTAGVVQRSIRMGCNRHLLAAAHTSISLCPVVAVLKAMLVVSDVVSTDVRSQASISDILGTSDMGCGSNDSDVMGSSGKGADKGSLSDFAKYTLRQICSQDWVHERCLKIPEELCGKENLLDDLLTSRQAQRLLRHICHPDASVNHKDFCKDQRTIISHILQDLNEWTLRISWLDLHLMYEQHRSSTSELNIWLDNVAQAAVDAFHLNPENEVAPKSRSHKASSIHLVAPLISKLPKAVQGRVLQVAGKVLDSVNFGSYNFKSGGNTVSSYSGLYMGPQTSGTSTLPHKPFLQLVLMCLEGQDETPTEALLKSLQDQLMQLLVCNKEEKSSMSPEDGLNRQMMLEALQLRFALIGGLFDYLTSKYRLSSLTEWAVLLVDLIIYSVIDLTNNSELFPTILDMLATLIHSTLLFDVASDTREENKRNYLNLVRKLKKEIGERNNMSLFYVRQLIPLPKLHAEIVTLEPWGLITDTKGNRLDDDYDKDKKHCIFSNVLQSTLNKTKLQGKPKKFVISKGLQAAEKQKLSPWDLIDGQRHPAPLSWAWFGAIRQERKPLKYEEVHRLLRFHTHSIKKPVEYYLEPPILPPEDLEPMPEKMCKDEIRAPETPMSDQSPRSNSKRGGKTQRKNTRRQPRSIGGGIQNITSPTMPSMNYPSPVYTNTSPNQWAGFIPQQQQQQPFYAHHGQQPLPPAGGPRFQSSMSGTHGRGAIRQMLGQRVTPAIMGSQQTQQSFSNMSQVPGMGRQVPVIRSQVRGSLQGQQASMYAGPESMQAGPQSQVMSSQSGQMFMGSGQGGHGQYMGFQQNQSQMMGVPGSGGGPSMMPQNFQQGYQGGGGPMMGIRQQGGTGYMSQGMPSQMVQRPQFMQGSGGGHEMGMHHAYSRQGMGPVQGIVGAGQNMGTAGPPMGPGGQGMMSSSHGMGAVGQPQMSGNQMGNHLMQSGQPMQQSGQNMARMMAQSGQDINQDMRQGGQSLVQSQSGLPMGLGGQGGQTLVRGNQVIGSSGQNMMPGQGMSQSGQGIGQNMQGMVPAGANAQSIMAGNQNMMRQRMMMGVPNAAPHGMPGQGGSMMSHMQRQMTPGNQGQQQMMHSSAQSMGYQQPPFN